ncbi:MAG: DUF6079 family protein [Pyrinomonadaceae bacterium]|nr:DUF6079 family protein [Pyrinomonadaceae bacterium]
MKRIQEKVKDLVEVLPYKNLQDFISDPAQTLAAYHFTDFTSDLMAKWLDKIAAFSGKKGAANALAGYRGVGKSHFLATLGAILAHPELRSRITNPHAAASAQNLKRARYCVANVRRGTHDTLLAELKDALAETFETDAADLSDSLPELLTWAVHKSGDLPFILLVDTAFERASRVARDDGVMLGEIAETAEQLNIFVAVALDDDIAGADGINAAIAQRFSIDYLDQEHLYRIVDTHIFPKHRQMSALLHDIYTNFKTAMPNFRWSEQRFTSLYPLHPVILENAPFVRLYAPEFALLGFASEAGAKILGRPANSLIALDEVFDSVEASLRKIEDLKDAVATYDILNSEVITQMPVMQRLQAKLTLKGLFLLSLEGDGTTAGEISAAMLIYDENDASKSVKSVEDLLETFVSALPEEIQRNAAESRETRYSLRVSSKDNLNQALAEAVKSVAPTVIPKILRRVARERFSDWKFSEENEGGDWTECRIAWRGGGRHGSIVWNAGDDSEPTAPVSTEFLDWEVIINSPTVSKQKPPRKPEISQVFWQPAPLRPDETETILRYYVLLTDQNLREEYGEQLRAAGHSNLMAVEKIWNRIFLEEATLEIEDFDYNFSEEARAAGTLTEVFSNMLEPLFENLYPEHPHFAETLDMNDVSQIVSDFFSGARQNLTETQRLAKTFALPLGLVAERNNSIVLETEDNLINLPLARKILAAVKENPETSVSLETIYRELKKSPYGLGREASHLILTALVAQRRIEFVTSRGDRINRRSLDLKIIWNDIEGIAKPSGVLYGDRRLTEWARMITGTKTFQSIDQPADRQAVKTALENWLADWQSERLLERFNDLPDEVLNTKIWRMATYTEKTFGTVAVTATAILDDTISLEEGLHRVADAFSDSEREFSARRDDLVVLGDFINGVGGRERIRNYLAICETTDDANLEFTREKLVRIIEESYFNPNSRLNDEMENLWQIFHAQFADYFAMKHDLVMKSHLMREKFDEFRRSDEWWEFETLSRLTIFQKTYWKEARELYRQLKELDCRFDVRTMLKTQPFCGCSFKLAQTRNWEKLPATLVETVARGRANYRDVLWKLKDTMVSLFEHFIGQMNDEDFTKTARRLIEIFKSQQIPLLTNGDLVVLQKVFDDLPTAPLLQITLPSDESFLSREELRVQLNDWLEGLPNEPVLLKI